MNCQIATETRVGRRPYNEDRLGYWQTGESLLLALADGMGGHAHGDVAAELALRCLADAFHESARPRLADPDVFLFRAIGRAHGALCAHARGQGLAETPRTTIVTCVVQDGYAYWTHVGDSRLYLVRDGKAQARTRDHTLVQQLLASGRISEDEAGAHPQRNVLMQCLGGPSRPRVEPARAVLLHRGDTILLCSDGFFGPLAPAEIGQAVAAGALESALAELAGLAEERGGHRCDNLSVVAVTWQEDASAAVSTAPAPAPASEPVPDYLALSDADIEREIERLRQAFRGRAAPAADTEPDFLALSDADIEREVERLRRVFRARAAPAPDPGADFLTVSDADIEREIERLRRVFRASAAPQGDADADFLTLSDADIEREVERIRRAFRASLRA